MTFLNIYLFYKRIPDLELRSFLQIIKQEYPLIRAIYIDEIKHEDISPNSLLISLGGDGTFLKMVGNIINRVPFASLTFLGIKAEPDSFGYFCKYSLHQVKEIINEIKNPRVSFFDPLQLQTQTHQRLFLNDVRVVSYNKIQADLDLNQEPFVTYIGSGVLVATGFGSTALNKSNYGPIIIPDFNNDSLFNSYVVSGIQPINNRINTSFISPVVLPTQIELSITPSGTNYTVIVDTEDLGMIKGELKISSHPTALRIILDHDLVAYLDRFRRLQCC